MPHINQLVYFMKNTDILNGVRKQIHLSEDFFQTVIVASTGNNVWVSFLVHQIPCTSTTVLQYCQVFTQFSFYTRVSNYTRRLMIANLLYSIPKVLNSYHFAYRSSRLCLHVCLVKGIINLSITSKYLLKKLASGTYLLASFSVQRGG